MNPFEMSQQASYKNRERSLKGGQCEKLTRKCYDSSRFSLRAF
uniref:Uncharacterized protein n=1 Tax=Anguilla anguilla TaxID=7936 RepID=A0A0E9RLG2_ANGAN